MPITASLGALSYAKTQLGNYEHWYMQTSSNITFSSFAFDNESAFYVLGHNSAGTRYQISKFKEIDDFPYTLITTDYQISQGQGAATSLVSTDIKYNPVDNNLIVVGSCNIPYWPIFPYNSSFPAVNYTISKTLSPLTTSLDYSDIPTSYSTYPYSVDIDTTNGNIYYAGYAETGSSGGPDSFFVSKKINIDSTGANTSYTAINYPFLNIDPIGTSTVKLDSTGNVIYCGITQQTSTTDRAVILRKANKTPVIGGFNYYLPTIWQVRVAANNFSAGTTFQSEDLVIDSADNIYLLANQSSVNRSFIVKFNNSGTLQWQIRLENVMLESICTDSNDDIYVLGRDTGNDLFVAKYTNAGIVSWERQLSGVAYTAQKILNVGSNLYLLGNTGTNGFMMKVPNDGTIPGTGTYRILGATLTYSSASSSSTSSALLITTPTIADNTIGRVFQSGFNTSSSATLTDYILGLS